MSSTIRQWKLLVVSCYVLAIVLRVNESATGVTNLFVCDFETGTCGVVSDKTASFSWTRASGIATENILYTGPLSGQGGSLWYFYIDSRVKRYGDEARFTTQPLNYVGDVCIEFFYEMFGQTVNTLGVYLQIPGGNRNQIWSLQGNQGNQWLMTRVDVILYNYNLTVGWRAVVGSNQYSDIAVDSIRIFTGICPSSTISLPFGCDFESTDLCQMASSSVGDFEWLRQSGNPTSLDTGPPGAASGSYYLLMNASFGTVGERAIEVTPPILYSGLACVAFYYYMWGLDVAQLMIVTNTIGFAFPWLTLSGQQANSWLMTSVSVSLSNNTDKVGFIAVRGASVLSYIAVDNIQITVNQCPGDKSFDFLVSMPFICTFEMDFCNMTSLPPGNFAWTRQSGKTDTLDTGPGVAFEGNYYIYAEGSAPRQPGDKAYLSTPGLRYSGNMCIRFAYYMYGSGVGQLQVYTRFKGESSPVFSVSADQGNLWFQASIDLSLLYADSVVFVATRGSNVFSDIAIDYLVISPTTCDSSGPYVTTTTTPTPPVQDNRTVPAIIAPYISCDMEQAATPGSHCRIFQDPNGNFPWTQTSGRTPSGRISNRRVNGVLYPVTGPDSAAQGFYYIYIEASGREQGSLARLIVIDDYISETKCLRFYFTMNGFHTGVLRVYRVISDVLRDFLWMMSGDQLPGWKIAAVDINMTSVTEIGIEAITALEDDAFSGDTSLDNLTISRGSCSSMVWMCNFETSDGASTLCTMQINRNVDYEWTLWTGKTPSAETGPSKAFNGLYYIYAEASSPRVQGDMAENRIRSLPVNGSVCLAFYYHMLGVHMGSLQVYTVDVRNVYALQWSVAGNQGNVWLEARIFINALCPTDQIALRAIRGSAFSSDIAVDNIRVSVGQC